MNHQYQVEVLEYCTSETMVDQVELCCVFCTSSTCRVSSKHLNYKKHSMVRLLYQFHEYYHVRGVLKRLQVPLPYELGFNATDNLYSGEGLLKLYEDYGVPTIP